MAATITDRTTGSAIVQMGGSINPFANIDINDPIVMSSAPPYISGGVGTLTVHLMAPQSDHPYPNLGTLAESAMGPASEPGSFDPATATFTDFTAVGPTAPGNLSASNVLHNLQYTAPILSMPPGAFDYVYAQVGYVPYGGTPVYDANPVELKIGPAAAAATPATIPAPAVPATPATVSAPAGVAGTAGAAGAAGATAPAVPATPATIPAPTAPAAPDTTPAPVALITPTTIGAPVFRFYNPADEGHFFTSNVAEVKQIQAGNTGLVLEGPAFHAVDPATDTNAVPVYRFYEPSNNSHFYTDSVTEMQNLVASNPKMILEGPAFNVDASMQAGDVTLYRYYEPRSDTHLYTSNAAEMSTIATTRPDMILEGPAFYAKA